MMVVLFDLKGVGIVVAMFVGRDCVTEVVGLVMVYLECNRFVIVMTMGLVLSEKSLFPL